MPRMSTECERHLKSLLQTCGWMSIAEFMAVALTHPQYGYYTTRQPLGRQGDFTTAPEISQCFGEMIGLWLMDRWQKMGAPNPFVLVECGGGRGTLMADVLRTVRSQSVIFQALAGVHLVEISPVLRTLQQQAVQPFGVDCTFHDVLETLPKDAPLFLIANEFFDALPIHQQVFQNGQWVERGITLDDANSIVFSHTGEIREHSPESLTIAGQMAKCLRTQKGAAIIMDYGYMQHKPGDSLQAVRQHQKVDVLSHIGEADLTAHVDFGALRRVFHDAGLHTELTTQGIFLREMGILLRLAQLLKTANPAQKPLLESGVERLIAEEQMGELFKILTIF